MADRLIKVLLLTVGLLVVIPCHALAQQSSTSERRPLSVDNPFEDEIDIEEEDEIGTEFDFIPTIDAQVSFPVPLSTALCWDHYGSILAQRFTVTAGALSLTYTGLPRGTDSRAPGSFCIQLPVVTWGIHTYYVRAEANNATATSQPLVVRVGAALE